MHASIANCPICLKKNVCICLLKILLNIHIQCCTCIVFFISVVPLTFMLSGKSNIVLLNKCILGHYSNLLSLF